MSQATVTPLVEAGADALEHVDLLTEYLVWSDRRLLSILDALTEEEFTRGFNQLSGNIHSKTAHIVSIYDFFLAILDGEPYETFPDRSDRSKEELLARWMEILDLWGEWVASTRSGLFALPLAGGRRVSVEHIYLDGAIHAIHHRGQILTFIRLLGKDTDEVSPKDTNLDYLMYAFQERPELIHPPEE